MCKTMCKGKCCACSCAAKWLLVVGGLNWGLVGLGQLFGGSDWNVVGMIFGSIAWLEAIIYLLVGVSAIISVFGCPCKTCKAGESCCKTDKQDGCCGGGCDGHDTASAPSEAPKA